MEVTVTKLLKVIKKYCEKSAGERGQKEKKTKKKTDLFFTALTTKQMEMGDFIAAYGIEEKSEVGEYPRARGREKNLEYSSSKKKTPPTINRRRFDSIWRGHQITFHDPSCDGLILNLLPDFDLRFFFFFFFFLIHKLFFFSFDRRRTQTWLKSSFNPR